MTVKLKKQSIEQAQQNGYIEYSALPKHDTLFYSQGYEFAQNESGEYLQIDTIVIDNPHMFGYLHKPWVITFDRVIAYAPKWYRVAMGFPADDKDNMPIS